MRTPVLARSKKQFDDWRRLNAVPPGELVFVRGANDLQGYPRMHRVVVLSGWGYNPSLEKLPDLDAMFGLWPATSEEWLRDFRNRTVTTV